MPIYNIFRILKKKPFQDIWKCQIGYQGLLRRKAPPANDARDKKEQVLKK